MRGVVHGRVPGLSGSRSLPFAMLAALVAAAVAVLVVSLASGPAEAASPGENGQIAFSQEDGSENNDGEIYTSEPLRGPAPVSGADEGGRPP